IISFTTTSTPETHTLSLHNALPIFTAREAEVLLWVAQGKSNGDVASILGMSEKTVKQHMGSIFQKIGVESRNAATVRALEILGKIGRATSELQSRGHLVCRLLLAKK